MPYPSAPGTALLANANATIDYSNSSEGYITVKYHDDPSKRCKVQISCAGRSQHFEVPQDGSPKVYPLCYGDGKYAVRVYRQVANTKYSEIAALNIEVKLRDQRAPFLYPNTYAEYSPNSTCVKIAAELCSGLKSDALRIGVIYRWIIGNVEYDKDLALRVRAEKWWLPNPDEVIAEGKSICFGYSSLMAAMCRSQGIPAKITVGTVGAGGLHAWNEVYSKVSGNVAGVSIRAEDWSRIDVTLTDGLNGMPAAFVLDDTNYSAQYCG